MYGSQIMALFPSVTSHLVQNTSQKASQGPSGLSTSCDRPHTPTMSLTPVPSPFTLASVPPSNTVHIPVSGNLFSLSRICFPRDTQCLPPLQDCPRASHDQKIFPTWHKTAHYWFFLCPVFHFLFILKTLYRFGISLLSLKTQTPWGRECVWSLLSTEHVFHSKCSRNIEWINFTDRELRK